VAVFIGILVAPVPVVFLLVVVQLVVIAVGLVALVPIVSPHI
jgi:hypothetical protein